MVSVGKEKLRGGILHASFEDRIVQNFQNAVRRGLRSIKFLAAAHIDPTRIPMIYNASLLKCWSGTASPLRPF
jgi:hypothetical protein